MCCMPRAEEGPAAVGCAFVSLPVWLASSAPRSTAPQRRLPPLPPQRSSHCLHSATRRARNSKARVRPGPRGPTRPDAAQCSGPASFGAARERPPAPARSRLRAGTPAAREVRFPTGEGVRGLCVAGCRAASRGATTPSRQPDASFVGQCGRLAAAATPADAAAAAIAAAAAVTVPVAAHADHAPSTSGRGGAPVAAPAPARPRPPASIHEVGRLRAKRGGSAANPGRVWPAFRPGPPHPRHMACAPCH